MKKCSKFLLFGVIICLLVPVFVLSKGKYEERDLLMRLLEESDATFLEGDIDMGGAIIDRFISVGEIESIADIISRDLSIKGESDRNLIEEDGFIQLIVQGIDEYENLITFSLTSYKDVDDGQGETSLFINLIKREQFVEINGIIEKVEIFFEGYDKPVNITNCIVGTFDGYVDMEKKQEKILNMIKSIKGKIVEKYSEDDVLSISVYTPYIEKYIYTGNNKMNLNIALRHNEYENKTYIWIGTPIITIGY